jgi:hypothetical protein
MIPNKKLSGLTLVELIIAVGVLVSVSAGLMSLFSLGHSQSVVAHRRNLAGIEAQLQMERLMGRRWDLDLAPRVFYTNYNDPVGTVAPLVPRGRAREWGVCTHCFTTCHNTCPNSHFPSTCGTFIITKDYEIRRTNFRSFDSDPEPGDIFYDSSCQCSVGLGCASVTKLRTDRDDWADVPFPEFDNIGDSLGGTFIADMVLPPGLTHNLDIPGVLDATSVQIGVGEDRQMPLFRSGDILRPGYSCCCGVHPIPPYPPFGEHERIVSIMVTIRVYDPPEYTDRLLFEHSNIIFVNDPFNPF